MEEEKIRLETHKEINQVFAGKLIEQKDHYAKVKLETREEMAVDSHGLIHGGFLFSAADFCAMATVNHPNVVLVTAKVKFLVPAKVGDVVYFESEMIFDDDKKQEISVIGRVNGIKIFEGLFGTVVLKKHVLKMKITD
ncbi:MAG: PaaI family thioesterase [Epsilonproteobacteria bacterium]|nr:PaaI family thioesterase [Campylobacterota bacterium]